MPDVNFFMYWTDLYDFQVETNDPTAQEELDNDGVEALASSKPKMVVSILSKVIPFFFLIRINILLR